MDYWLTRGGGWDFDRYRADFPWSPAGARTSQSGRADLEPLRTDLPAAWEAHAADLRRALAALLGAPPAPDAPPGFRVLSSERAPGYARRLVDFAADGAERVPAYLLVPDGAEDGPPRPAVVCLHQTVTWGKQEPCGLHPGGNPDLALAHELALRGMVCLAPDAICFGERYRAGDPYAHYGDAVAFYGRFPEWSVMGKMAFDVSRAVDSLLTLPYVRPGAVGCIGHSHGAYGTLFAMLAEPRIAAGALSCGFTPLRDDPTPGRWWRLTALMPRLGWFEGRMHDAPFDFHHLLALIAPRPLFVWYALSDGIFPNTERIGWMVEEARRAYALYGAPAALRAGVFAGDHRFPPEGRSAAYAHLEESL